MVVVRVRRHRPQRGADERAEQRDRQRPRLGAVDELLQHVAARQAFGFGVAETPPTSVERNSIRMAILLNSN